MQIVVKPVSELKKAAVNIRKHSQKQIEEYAKSIKMFGQIKPIVCDEDGVIWCGNGLYEALVYAGIDTAECYVYTGLTEKQKKKLMLADNKVYELGLTDMFAFEETIKSLEGDFDIPGWDNDLLEILTTTQNEVAKAVTEYGVAEANDRSVPVQQEHVSGGSTDKNTPYTPVVRDETTGEIKRPEESLAPNATEISADRPFVICPKCGEKIWL